MKTECRKWNTVGHNKEIQTILHAHDQIIIAKSED